MLTPPLNSIDSRVLNCEHVLMVPPTCFTWRYSNDMLCCGHMQRCMLAGSHCCNQG